MDIAGQSLRAGGATMLAEMGFAPHIIQAAGRWSSEAFQIYVRKNPFLLLLELARSWTRYQANVTGQQIRRLTKVISLLSLLFFYSCKWS